MADLAGLGLVSNDAGLNGGSGGVGRDYLNIGSTALLKVHTAGSAETCSIWLSSGVPTVSLKIWRPNGANYDYVGRREMNNMSGGLNTDVPLQTAGSNNPINVEVGDIVGFHVIGGNSIRLMSAAADSSAWDGTQSDYTSSRPQSSFTTTFPFIVNFLLKGTATFLDIAVTTTRQAWVRNRSTNLGDITLDGIYSPGATSLERRIRRGGVTIEDWAVFDASPSNETWTLTEEVAGSVDEYVFDVRWGNDHAKTASSINQYMGDAFAGFGESTEEDMQDDGTAVPDQGVLAWNPVDNTVVPSQQGAGQISRYNTISAHTAVASFYINLGVGGSSLLQVNGSSGDNANYIWNNLDPMSRVQFAGLVDAYNAIGDLACVFLSLGANDAYWNNASTAEIITGYAEMFAELRTRTRSNLKVITSLAGRHLDPAVDDAGWVDNVLAQKDAFDADVDVHYTTFYDLGLKDSVHPDLAGYIEKGVREANGAITEVYGGNAPYKPMVAESFEQTNSTTTVVTIGRPNGTDFTPVTGITQFRPRDGVTLLAVTNAVNTTPNTITITHDSGTVTEVGYNDLPDPDVSNVAVDNSARQLPMLQARVPLTFSVDGATAATEAMAFSATVAFTSELQVSGALALSEYEDTPGVVTFGSSIIIEATLPESSSAGESADILFNETFLVSAQTAQAIAEGPQPFINFTGEPDLSQYTIGYRGGHLGGIKYRQ